MAIYHCRFLDSAGHLVATKIIDCEMDSDVRETADALLSSCGYSGVEIWDGQRRVFGVRRIDAPLLAAE